MASKPNRTPDGDVSQGAREKYGDQHGAFPVFDHRSAMSAVQLRGHAPDPAKILTKVSKYANANNDQEAKNAVADARKVDRGK